MTATVKRVICIGYEPREHHAFEIAKASVQKYAPEGTLVTGIYLDELRSLRWYNRKTEVRDGRLWDAISDAPMSTEFAISRFLSIEVADHAVAQADLEWDYDEEAVWIMFMDCDMLVRKPLAPLFELASSPDNIKKAVLCVQHQYNPPEGIKMDGQFQLQYARKNWSSVMLLNAFHASNMLHLTTELVNSVPGRDLHRFCWLQDHEIGSLPVEYNWLVDHSPADVDPTIVHFTTGIPSMPGYENVPYADEWREWLSKLQMN